MSKPKSREAVLEDGLREIFDVIERGKFIDGTNPVIKRLKKNIGYGNEKNEETKTPEDDWRSALRVTEAPS